MQRLVFRLPLRDDSDLAEARLRVRALCAGYGFASSTIEGLATAASEVARNVLVHAHDGELCGGTTHRDGRVGVVVVARDSGPGIATIADAMCDGFSTRGGLGLGLPSARRLVDDFEIHSLVNAGTTVTLTMWAGFRASELAGGVPKQDVRVKFRD